MRKWILSAALALCGLSAIAQAEMGAVHIMDAKARASLPGVKNSAAFMQLHNMSDSTLQLVAAESEVAKHVELHNHLMIDGKMAMRQVENISLPAKQSVSLAPGGFHVMLIDLVEPLEVGESIELTLLFSNGERQTLTVPVQSIMMAKKHMGHDH